MCLPGILPLPPLQPPCGRPKAGREACLACRQPHGASERGCSCGRPSRSPCLVPLCFLSRSVSFSSELVTQLVTHWERTETLNETGYRPSICKDGESWKKAAEGRARFWTRGRNEGRAERGRGAAGGRSCGNRGQAGRLRGTAGPWGWGQGAARPPARPGVSRARVHLPPLPGTNEHWGPARLPAPGSVRLSEPEAGSKR